MCVNTFHTYWRYYYTGDKTRNDREMKFYTKKEKKKKKEQRRQMVIRGNHR